MKHSAINVIYKFNFFEDAEGKIFEPEMDHKQRLSRAKVRM